MMTTIWYTQIIKMKSFKMRMKFRKKTNSLKKIKRNKSRKSALRKNINLFLNKI